jgi:nucleotide-binding universal stress UspA family protein
MPRILIGLDPSDDADRALTLSLSWARRADWRLTALGIVDEPTIRRPEAVSFGGTSFKAHRDDARVQDALHQVSEVLDQFGRRCAAAGVPSEGRLVSGLPAEQILLEAERHDLIVLARESHFHFETQESADETLRLVLRAMSRPVISVAGDIEAPGPVVVAYGTGIHSTRALQMFALLHPPLESDVVVVAVDSEETPSDSRAARAVDFLQAHSIPARAHVVASHQPVADILIELAAEWEARMVVMGVHLVGELGARLFGSVTASMLEDAGRPLFLYH